MRANMKDAVKTLRLIQVSCLTVEDTGSSLRYFVSRRSMMLLDGGHAELVRIEDKEIQKPETDTNKK